MVDKITREQLDELEEARFLDLNEYNKLLEKYTGIKAESYKAFSYYDCAGNYLGDSNDSTTDEILRAAYVEVTDND